MLNLIYFANIIIQIFLAGTPLYECDPRRTIVSSIADKVGW